VHSNLAAVLFACIFIGVPVGAGWWLGRRAQDATQSPSRALERPDSAVGLLSALMAVLHAAQDVVAICPRCHLDEETPCVCPARRQRLAGAVTSAEEALRGQLGVGAGTALGASPKTCR
jgi:hypothetical protein